jgi:hypothetical protein
MVNYGDRAGNNEIIRAERSFKIVKLADRKPDRLIFLGRIGWD